jgi:hypothetical protein
MCLVACQTFTATAQPVLPLLEPTKVSEKKCESVFSLTSWHRVCLKKGYKTFSCQNQGPKFLGTKEIIFYVPFDSAEIKYSCLSFYFQLKYCHVQHNNFAMCHQRQTVHITVVPKIIWPSDVVIVLACASILHSVPTMRLLNDTVLKLCPVTKPHLTIHP